MRGDSDRVVCDNDPSKSLGVYETQTLIFYLLLVLALMKFAPLRSLLAQDDLILGIFHYSVL